MFDFYWLKKPKKNNMKCLRISGILDLFAFELIFRSYILNACKDDFINIEPLKDKGVLHILRCVIEAYSQGSLSICRKRDCNAPS